MDVGVGDALFIEKGGLVRIRKMALWVGSLLQDPRSCHWTENSDLGNLGWRNLLGEDFYCKSVFILSSVSMK